VGSYDLQHVGFFQLRVSFPERVCPLADGSQARDPFPRVHAHPASGLKGEFVVHAVAVFLSLFDTPRVSWA